ncbi:hypothetical protein L6Q96_09395 [Candidatus Binatia bacterium]|nr:hypothetical protein [Candidatus Binatia bacterium]
MRRALRLLLPFGWMAALWHLSATPAPLKTAVRIELPAWVQNALHVPLYAIVGLAWYGALRGAVSSRAAAALLPEGDRG